MQKLVDKFYESDIAEQTGGYLYTQVQAGLITKEEAKQKLKKFLVAFTDITENSSMNTNYLDMFENLFSNNDNHKSFAMKYYKIK